MTIRQRGRFVIAVLAAAFVVPAIGASSASAVLKRLPNGQTVSYQPLAPTGSQVTPFDALFANMDYNGGPVMPSNTNYMVLWSPQGPSRTHRSSSGESLSSSGIWRTTAGAIRTSIRSVRNTTT